MKTFFKTKEIFFVKLKIFLFFVTPNTKKYENIFYKIFYAKTNKGLVSNKNIDRANSN